MFGPFFRWLEARVAAFPLERPIKPNPRFFGFIMHYTRPFIPLLVVGIFLSILIAIIETRAFAYLGTLVDALNSSSPEIFWNENRFSLILVGTAILILLPILSFISDAIENQGLRSNYSMRIRWLAHRYLLQQSMDFFHNDFAGRIAAKLMQAANSVCDAVMRITQILVYVIVYFISTVILFAQNDLLLSIPLLVWLCGCIGTGCYFIPRIGKTSKIHANMRSLVTGRVVDSYTNISTVKLFSHAAREENYAREGMELMLDSVKKAFRLNTLFQLLINFLNDGLLFATAATGILLWMQGQVTSGTIAFTVGLVYRIQNMSNWLMWEMASLVEDIGVVHDGMATIARDFTIQDKADAKPLQAKKGEIIFDNVHFNYGKQRPSHGHDVIDGLDLHILSGEKVGLIGRSGSGKSTLINLLLRFYDVKSGSILIDSQDIAHVTQESLRANIGIVTQDTSLLHRSILDNLHYGRNDATIEEVKAAAAKAHADHFIEGLVDPNGRRGYDAYVGERGIKLSGGQRQRIAIARVLLKNAPILILDEATSALDSEIEAAIQENLYIMMEGKTVIAVAHRLSTIAAMDRLVIIDEGQIIEEGTHKQLLKKQGLYAKLWSRQSGGFLIDEK